MFYLDKPSSEEFLEIYKTLIPEISEMVNKNINISAFLLHENNI